MIVSYEYDGVAVMFVFCGCDVCGAVTFNVLNLVTYGIIHHTVPHVGIIPIILCFAVDISVSLFVSESSSSLIRLASSSYQR